MLAKTEGGPAGCRSRLILPQGISIQIAWPSLLPTGWASTPERDHTADHCGPPSVRPPVLVILLVQRGRYLFLHQPQLITQVAVGFHKVLDLGFRGRECVFHLHVFLHSNGAIWEVRVQALRRRGVKRVKAPRERERLCLWRFFTWRSIATIPWSDLLCSRGGLDLYPHQMPRCRSQAGHCPGYRYNACQPRSSG